MKRRQHQPIRQQVKDSIKTVLISIKDSHSQPHYEDECVTALVHFPNGEILESPGGNRDKLLRQMLTKGGKLPMPTTIYDEDGREVEAEENQVVESRFTRFIKQTAELCGCCEMAVKAQTGFQEILMTLETMRDAFAKQALSAKMAKDSSSTPMNTQSNASKLSVDVWTVIASYMPQIPVMLLPLTLRVCFDWRDQIVWETLYVRTFGVPAVMPESSFRELYVFNMQRAAKRRGGPLLERFVEGVCPEGMLQLGGCRLTITDYQPVTCSSLAYATHRFMLEACIVNTPDLGPVTVVFLFTAQVGYPATVSTGPQTQRLIAAAVKAGVTGKTLEGENGQAAA